LKPDPEAFLGPLRRLGISPKEAAVVGDSHLDLLAAHAARVALIILLRPSDWMRPFFPTGAIFQEVQTLTEAQEVLARFLNRK